MNFEKEAREAIAPLFNQPHPFQEEWSPMHSMSLDDLVKSIATALRAASERAFIAGQEEMRERAAHIINSNVVALSRMAETAKKSRLHDEQDLMETQCVFAQELESFIRSLPINPLPNEKEG